MPPDPPSIPESPDSADRLLDEMMLFLRGGPVPDPPAPGHDAVEPPAPGPGTASWNAGGETADPAGRATPPPGEGDTDPGRVIGPYRIVTEVEADCGGMGVVYQARHLHLPGREVALKTIRAGLDGRAGMRQRFRTEAAAVARLDHPHIVRLYDFDEDAGQLYYAMEWAPGGNLARRTRSGPLEPREAAGLVRDLARAMAFAHENKVLHRDLKPNNVLIAADGRVKVADFGLARLLDDEATRLTADDAVMGTPAYMAPEQANGRVADIDARTDVYALGAVLYEVITGGPPFTAPTRFETLAKVRVETPARPSSVRPGLPPDLETVCLRCLEKDRADRYQSAAALAADLDHVLAGEPLAGRPWARVRKAARFARRRWRVGAFVGLLAAAVGGALYLTPVPALEPTEAEKLASARAKLARDLDAGGPVVLIPDGGPPRYAEVCRPTDPTTRPSTALDGSFQLSSWAEGMHIPGLTELVPDPRRESFLFRVKVRHDHSNTGGEIGVYVGDRPFPGPAGRENGWAVTITLNNIHSHADVVQAEFPPEVVARLLPQVAAVPNQVALRIFGRGEQRAGEYWAPSRELAGGAPFTPVGLPKPRWVALEVRVTPAGVSATKDGTPVGSAGVDRVRTVVQTFRADAATRTPNPCWEACDPNLNPRGGIGLVVRRGVASFRDAVIEPLNP